MGRVFAIGDVHGEAVALETLLNAIAPAAEDVVVQLGDLCDRGPDVAGCFELLTAWSDRCRVEMVRGNHDEMMLDCCEGRTAGLHMWLNVGGKETLASYGDDIEAVPEAHLQWVRDAWPFVIVGTDVLTHAGVDVAAPLDDQQPDDVLRWKKTTGGEPRLPCGRRVVCGHTAQTSGRPKVWPGWVCIDTKPFSPSGRLTALELGVDVVHQSDRFGRVYDPVPLEDVATC